MMVDIEPSRAAIQAMAEHLLEEECETGWVWPTHRDDDGYRGNGYVRIAPPDVQWHLRDKARRVLICTTEIAATFRPAAKTFTLVTDEGGTFLNAEAGQLFICADINTVRRVLTTIGASSTPNDEAGFEPASPISTPNDE